MSTYARNTNQKQVRKSIVQAMLTCPVGTENNSHEHLSEDIDLFWNFYLLGIVAVHNRH